jgi:hypothetical protein
MNTSSVFPAVVESVPARATTQDVVAVVTTPAFSWTKFSAASGTGIPRRRRGNSWRDESDQPDGRRFLAAQLDALLLATPPPIRPAATSWEALAATHQRLVGLLRGAVAAEVTVWVAED